MLCYGVQLETKQSKYAWLGYKTFQVFAYRSRQLEETRYLFQKLEVAVEGGGCLSVQGLHHDPQ